MKYKVLKGTKLYDSLMAIKEKIIDCNNTAFDLSKQMGAIALYGSNDLVLAGGISAVHFGKKKPKGFPHGWKRVYKNRLGADTYMPSNIKANAAILAEIAALPVVDNKELNDLLDFDWRIHGSEMDTESGGNRIIFRPTPHWGGKGINFILVSLPEWCTLYKPPKDLIEITTQEYQTLVDKINKK